MAKATIKSNSGMTVVVEGTKTEVAHIVRSIEQQDRKTVGGEIRSTRVAKTGKSNHTATDGVSQLREEGFFDKPKTLVEIKRALEEQGLIFPVTTLSGVVLRQLRRKSLRRIKREKNWQYVKGSKI